ncbi:hypothetical protein HD806DRAFT_518958 [Xylariaceae sp. AK1471]|nr:hypothetical protein HD806DRAFT_518958 [Xylariaceae sp. AK1471]
MSEESRTAEVNNHTKGPSSAALESGIGHHLYTPHSWRSALYSAFLFPSSFASVRSVLEPLDTVPTHSRLGSGVCVPKHLLTDGHDRTSYCKAEIEGCMVDVGSVANLAWIKQVFRSASYDTVSICTVLYPDPSMFKKQQSPSLHMGLK